MNKIQFESAYNILKYKFPTDIELATFLSEAVKITYSEFLNKSHSDDNALNLLRPGVASDVKDEKILLLKEIKNDLQCCDENCGTFYECSACKIYNKIFRFLKENNYQA